MTQRNSEELTALAWAVVAAESRLADVLIARATRSGSSRAKLLFGGRFKDQPGTGALSELACNVDRPAV